MQTVGSPLKVSLRCWLHSDSDINKSSRPTGSKKVPASMGQPTASSEQSREGRAGRRAGEQAGPRGAGEGRRGSRRGGPGEPRSAARGEVRGGPGWPSEGARPRGLAVGSSRRSAPACRKSQHRGRSPVSSRRRLAGANHSTARGRRRNRRRRRRHRRLALRSSGRRGPRAGGGGKTDVGGRGRGGQRGLAKHPAPLREAAPAAPSRPDTKGGVTAAASLRRSRSPESPRLRRLLLLLPLPDPCLSRACGAARAATAAAASERRTAPARSRPRPATPLVPRLALARRLVARADPGQGGAGVGQTASFPPPPLLLLTPASPPARGWRGDLCDLCVCVCVREERGHATLGSGRKAWRTSRRRCLLREPRPPGRVAFPSPRGANKSLGLRGEDRDAAPCAR